MRTLRTLPWLFLLVAPVALAASDQSGSTDPLGIQRYPHSWILSYEKDDDPLPREFVVSAVEQSGREVRIKQHIRINGSAESATYQMPEGSVLEDVIQHYRRVLGDNILFQCRRRDCGRSNGWANQVFKQAILYGPDLNQFYQASDIGGALVSVYVIERGNRRIHAHVLVYHPDNKVEAMHNNGLTEALAGDGFAIVEGVILKNNQLTEESLQVLKDLAPSLDIFNRQNVYVVCHVYGPGEPSDLLEASSVCAAKAASALTRSDGPTLEPFGAGAMLPRMVNGRSRIELVLPHRQSRD
ncbi:MAG: DUF4892 domain-containing protein [Proteobacteria bacterium]|nr:DUF4892 domain-containing protein [Pseudomonadota bacterium]